MSWLLVDDKFHAHKKARRAGAEALGLWVMCGSHAAGMDAGGLLEADEVETIALTMRLRDWKRAAAKLVEVGLWDSVGADYQIHDFDHYRRGGDREQAKRERDAQRMREKREREAEESRDSRATVATESRDVADDSRATVERPSQPSHARPRAPVHSVPFSPVPIHAAAVPDAGDPAGGGGEVLDMSELRRAWNEAREVATGAMFPATFSPDDNAALAALPKVRAAAPRPKADFAAWLAVEFDAWRDDVTEQHGANAARITRAWSPVSFAGWYERHPPPAEAPSEARQVPQAPPVPETPALPPLSAEERAARAAAVLAKLDAPSAAPQRPRFHA